MSLLKRYVGMILLRLPLLRVLLNHFSFLNHGKLSGLWASFSVVGPAFSKIKSSLRWSYRIWTSVAPARMLILMPLLLSNFLFLFPSSVRAEAEAEACTIQAKLTGVIGPASLDLIQRSFQLASSKKCSSLLLLINTPGGSLQSTRLVVGEILNANIPTLCYVHPSGAHAGSAGAIILQACHVSGAMEATNIGAATPISSSGKDIQKDLRKKILNDTKSFVESLIKLRHRNEKFGNEIITEAKAVSAKEAVKIGAIDFRGHDIEGFLKFAQGRSVKIEGGKEILVSTGPLVQRDQDLRFHLIELLTDPQTAYLMFMGSLGLLYFEITHPGLIAPGVIGGIGLVVSLMSLHKLDVVWGGLMLLLLGVALMIAEAFVPSFGILGIGGTISFFMGSLFLFDPQTSGYQMPLSTILPTSLLLGAGMLTVAYWAFKTKKLKTTGDFEEFIGKDAHVVKVKKRQPKEGMIYVLGENWTCKADEPLELHSSVKIIGRKGFTLLVKSNKSKPD